LTINKSIPFFINSPDSISFVPNFPAGNVNVSFVWLSKVGFSINAFTSIHIRFLICVAFTVAPLIFSDTPAITFFAIWSAMTATWVLPLIVAIEFAKETRWKEPSETANATSDRLPTRSKIAVCFGWVCYRRLRRPPSRDIYRYSAWNTWSWFARYLNRPWRL